MRNADFTLGVEEEYQLVDASTGELRSGAEEVLRTDWGGELRAEMQQTVLEIGTPVCGSADEVRAQLARLRLQASATAATGGLAVIAAGLHPDDQWPRQRVTEGERYARLAARLGRVSRTDHIFGMHVHVAVPSNLDRLRLIADLRVYLPHLLALAASSPIYGGQDTGFDSYRMVLAGRLPNSGMPPALESEADFNRMLEVALAAGVLPDRSSLYWSLRPHHHYPTLEFRVCDATPRLQDAVAIAALARAMVATAAQGRLAEPHRLPAGTLDTLLRANEWEACRYGLGAQLVRLSGPGAAEPLADGVRRLLDIVAPAAKELGDTGWLQRVEQILEDGNAADRIRRNARSDGELIQWLAAETLLGTGLDRRREQRPADAAAHRPAASAATCQASGSRR
jgi:glutamate---cysteine ligase / carboxylate-amine ligase